MATTTATRTYKIDKSHSEAIFQVRHLVTKVRGRFTDFEGAIEYNDANPEASTVNFSAKTASIDTAEADRDKHLRSADFFDVEKFPELTFRSKRISKRGDGYDVTGDLTIHGVTKEVTLPVAHMGKCRIPGVATVSASRSKPPSIARTTDSRSTSPSKPAASSLATKSRSRSTSRQSASSIRRCRPGLQGPGLRCVTRSARRSSARSS